MDVKALYSEKLKMTREEFAEFVDRNVDSVENWEKDSELPSGIVGKIAEKAGLSVQAVMHYKEEPPLKFANKWAKANTVKGTISDYVNRALQQKGITEKLRNDYIGGLQTTIRNTLVKPKISVVGYSDSGKSTLINALFGVDKMPTDWTPTTSIAVFIKHISDRPSYMKEDVWVFKSQLGEEKVWNDRRLDDEEYCRSWLIASGGIDILDSHGKHDGEAFNADVVGSAVVFVDVEILKNCDIIDFPGFGTENAGDNKFGDATKEHLINPDIMIYLSKANGFLTEQEMGFLKNNIDRLESLELLFVVASQAHIITSGKDGRSPEEEIERILDRRCAAFYDKTLTAGYKEKLQKKHKSEVKKLLRTRFFSYSIDIPARCKAFNLALKKATEALPKMIRDKSKQAICEYVDMQIPRLNNEIEEYDKLINNADEVRRELEEIEDNELKRQKDNDKNKNEVRNKISKFKKDTISDFNSFCGNLLTEDKIIELLVQKEVKNKKDDIRLFMSWLHNTIAEKCQDLLEDASGELVPVIDKYTSKFQKESFDKIGVNAFESGYEAKYAFWRYLSAYGAIHGIGGFVFAGLGMLKIVGLVTLASIPVIGWIAAGAASLIMAVAGLWGWISGTWKKDVAKNFIKEFEKNDIQDGYITAIKKHWNDTAKAFDEAANELENDWQKHVTELREKVELSEKDLPQLESLAEWYKWAKDDFFTNIPL